MTNRMRYSLRRASRILFGTQLYSINRVSYRLLKQLKVMRNKVLIVGLIIVNRPLMRGTF